MLGNYLQCRMIIEFNSTCLPENMRIFGKICVFLQKKNISDASLFGIHITEQKPNLMSVSFYCLHLTEFSERILMEESSRVCSNIETKLDFFIRLK